MFIRKDLEEAIKSKFGIEKFVYKGIGRNTFNDCDSFIFDTGKGIMAIEVGILDFYYIYKIDETLESPENSYKIKPAINCWCCTFEVDTYLKVNGIVTQFPGKAFDFSAELVVLALEDN